MNWDDVPTIEEWAELGTAFEMLGEAAARATVEIEELLDRVDE